MLNDHLPVRRVLTRAMDLLLPPLCLSCDAPVGEQATLCVACWQEITFIAAPVCVQCGSPFEIAATAGMACGRCVAEPPAYDRARAALLYDEASRNIVLGFKHGDRTHAARALAVTMARADDGLLAQAEAVIPVPLHRWRLFIRRYNQSALLAQALSRITGVAVWPDALRRTRATPSQGHRKRKDRQANVRGAFALSPRYRDRIKSRRVVLIDDVLTTGATVEECAKILRKAGAARIDVLTLSRVKSMV